MSSQAAAPSSGPRVNKTILIAGLVVVLPLLALLYSGFGNDPHAIPSELIGKPAPPLLLQDMDGNQVNLAELKGQKVVINFWATWCGPCKQEHPSLLKYPQMYPDVKFYGVVYNDDERMARRYVKQAGSSFPQLIDPGNRVAISYGVTGVPETFFIDTKGIVREKFNGPLFPPYMAKLYPLLEGQ